MASTTTYDRSGTGSSPLVHIVLLPGRRSRSAREAVGLQNAQRHVIVVIVTLLAADRICRWLSSHATKMNPASGWSARGRPIQTRSWHRRKIRRPTTRDLLHLLPVYRHVRLLLLPLPRQLLCPVRIILIIVFVVRMLFLITLIRTAVFSSLQSLELCLCHPLWCAALGARVLGSWSNRSAGRPLGRRIKHGVFGMSWKGQSFCFRRSVD